MGAMTYVFLAYAVIWVAMLIYSLSIGNRQKSVEREIDMLKSVLAEKDGQVA